MKAGRAKFNLKKALAGHPVVTRDGRKVTKVVLHKDPPFAYYPIIAYLTHESGAIMGQEYSAFVTKKGRFITGVKTESDLFLDVSAKENEV